MDEVFAGRMSDWFSFSEEEILVKRIQKKRKKKKKEKKDKRLHGLHSHVFAAKVFLEYLCSVWLP